MLAQHCDSEACQEKDKFNYCCCKCEPCLERKDIEEDRAMIEWKALLEELDK